jgi:hypothetical protein
MAPPVIAEDLRNVQDRIAADFAAEPLFATSSDTFVREGTVSNGAVELPTGQVSGEAVVQPFFELKEFPETRFSYDQRLGAAWGMVRGYGTSVARFDLMVGSKVRIRTTKVDANHEMVLELTKIP